MQRSDVVAPLLVGLIWGATNPLIKRGAVAAEEKKHKHKQQTTEEAGWLNQWVLWLSTPTLVVPQLVNQSGSVLFTYLLGSGRDLSTLVPVANSAALAINAVTDLALGEQLDRGLLVLGVVLVAAGVLLCGMGAA